LDGSNSTYRPYEDGEPDDDVSCFVIEGDDVDLEIEDNDCDETKRYICKITDGKITIIILQILD